MKKKVKIILIIIIILSILALTFFVVDLSRIKKGEKPIFWMLKSSDFKEEIELNANKQPEKTSKYRALEDVESDYDLAKMIEDKCYIVMNSNVVYHIEELDNFIKNIENKKEDEIRIVEYTIEGQPIITNLEYKDNKFILKTDNRRDGFSAEEDKRIFTNEYDASKYTLVKSETSSRVLKQKTFYELSLQSLESNETVYICMYAEVKQDENQKFIIQFNKDINGEETVKILDREETDKYDYDIYSYKGTVDIIINEEKMSLREALLNNKITVEEILEKAKKDKENMSIYGDAYMDGGSIVYFYNDYSILKINNLQGNKDLYIGVPSMNINDLDI